MEYFITLGLTASIFAGRNPNFYNNSHVCIGLPLAQVSSYETKTTFTRIVDLNTIDPVPFEVVTNEHQSQGLYFSVVIFIGLNMLCFLLILAYIVIIKIVFQTSKEASRKREMAEEIDYQSLRNCADRLLLLVSHLPYWCSCAGWGSDDPLRCICIGSDICTTY